MDLLPIYVKLNNDEDIDIPDVVCDLVTIATSKLKDKEGLTDAFSKILEPVGTLSPSTLSMLTSSAISLAPLLSSENWGIGIRALGAQTFMDILSKIVMIAIGGARDHAQRILEMNELIANSNKVDTPRTPITCKNAKASSAGKAGKKSKAMKINKATKSTKALKPEQPKTPLLTFVVIGIIGSVVAVDGLSEVKQQAFVFMAVLTISLLAKANSDQLNDAIETAQELLQSDVPDGKKSCFDLRPSRAAIVARRLLKTK